jgi:type IV fimbrial biogenesis protein FimT
MDRQRGVLGNQKRRIVLLASAQYGFTLVEMLIGITIFAILVAVGLPSYTAWIQNTQIRSATESVLNGMQLARNEAVRRNTNVQLVLGAQSSWTISVPSTAEQIQARSYGAGSKNVTVAKTPGAATTITFNSLGRVTANADASATITQLDFDVPTTILAATASRNLRIVIAAGGNVRMCDPTVSDATDPRYC